MVSLTIYRDKVILFTEIAGKEYESAHPVTVSGSRIERELKVILEGLGYINRPVDLEVYTDVDLIVTAFRKGWVDNWIKNGWKKPNGKPVKNADLWAEVLRKLNVHRFLVKKKNIGKGKEDG